MLKTWLSRLWRSAFARDAALLSVGAAAAQLLATLALPVLSRLYDPAAFGRLAVLTAVAGIVATLITLRYESAIVLPNAEREADVLVALAFRLTLVLGPVCIALALLAQAWLPGVGAVAEMGSWLGVGAAVGVALAWVAVGNAALSRQRAYGQAAAVRIGQSALFVAAALGLGLLGMASGLLVAQVLASVAAAAWLSRRTGRSLHSRGAELRQAARAHAAAPRFLLPTALLDVITLQLPVLVIAARFGNDPAGQFSMAWRILGLPAALVGVAVAQVFFRTAAADLHYGVEYLRRRFLLVTFLLAAGAVLPVLGVALAGAALFGWALGPQWEPAGRISEVLVFSMAMYFVFSPSSSILIVLARQKVLLAFAVFQFAYRTAVALWADDIGTYVSALVLLECLNVVLFVAAVLWALSRPGAGSTSRRPS